MVETAKHGSSKRRLPQPETKHLRGDPTWIIGGQPTSIPKYVGLIGTQELHKILYPLYNEVREGSYLPPILSLCLLRAMSTSRKLSTSMNASPVGWFLKEKYQYLTKIKSIFILGPDLDLLKT
jgi:hypothetical protein